MMWLVNFFMYFLLGLISFFIFGHFALAPSPNLKTMTSPDKMLTWKEALCMIAFGGIFSWPFIDWINIHKICKVGVPGFNFSQQNVTDYRGALQAINEKELPAIPTDIVPIGYIMTVAVRMCYTVIGSLPYNCLGAAGVVVRGFAFETHRSLQPGQKCTLRAYTNPTTYVRKGYGISGVGILEDEAGTMYTKVECILLKMVRHGKKVDGKKTTPKEFSDDDVLHQEEWTVDQSLPSRFLDVSGDPNPIHMHPLLGKLFGLPGNIMHGTWIFGKVMQTFEEKCKSSKYKGEIKFIKPFIIPSTGVCKIYKTDDVNSFDVVVRVGKPGKRKTGAIATITRFD